MEYTPSKFIVRVGANYLVCKGQYPADIYYFTMFESEATVFDSIDDAKDSAWEYQYRNNMRFDEVHYIDITINEVTVDSVIVDALHQALSAIKDVQLKFFGK